MIIKSSHKISYESEIKNNLQKVLLNFASRSHNLYGCTSPTVRFFHRNEHALFSSHTFAQGSPRESLQFILQNTNHKSKVILNHLRHWISNLSLLYLVILFFSKLQMNDLTSTIFFSRYHHKIFPRHERYQTSVILPTW